MKKKPGTIRKSAAGLLLAGSLMFQTGTAWAALPPAADSLTALADSLGKDMGSLLSDAELLPAGDSVSDWIAFLTGRTGNKEMGAAYLDRLEEYVTKQYKEQGGLDPFTATSWHRIILTVAALGGEPTAFGQDADGNPVNLVADGCYNFHMTDSFDAQGMNAWLYALIALDSSDYKVPEDAKYTRESILEHIVSMQEEDGGFGLVKGASDVDITAMVLQALAPYQHNTVQYLDRNTFPVRISDVTDKALSYLSSMQQKDGGYKSSDVSNSESCSQVIIALCSLGIDPETDSRFIKESHSVVDALDAFRLDDGSYSHDDAMISDGMATQQAAFAGFSLEQFRSGGRRIFDLKDRPLDQAISLEAELSAMSEEEIKEKAEDLLKEYESVTLEDRSYVYSFSKVIHALEEKGIAFDEETSLYYELNDKTPTADATAGKSHSAQKSNAVLYAGIGILVIGIAGGTVVLTGKKKKKEEEKTGNTNKKVHW